MLFIDLLCIILHQRDIYRYINIFIDEVNEVKCVEY